MIIGYARVSTDGQGLDGQQTALKANGAERIFAEKISGAVTDRKQLTKAIAKRPKPKQPELAQNQTPPAQQGPGNRAINTEGVNNSNASVAGANSFTESQAKSRIEAGGYSNVSELKKDDNGVWRGNAMKNGGPRRSVWIFKETSSPNKFMNTPTILSPPNQSRNNHYDCHYHSTLR
jgi:Resolvase, N terminal domain